ncbi:MAG: hypothetical protein ACKPAD_11865, partial [Bacteroidota bacterium]
MKFKLQKTAVAITVCLLPFGNLFAQSVSFINANNKLANTTRSGCAVTVVDVNCDGLDDIVRMDQGHIIYLEL